MTELGYDRWAIERRQSDGVFEYVAFFDGETEVGVGRWDIARKTWSELPEALSALTPDLAEQLRARASDVMLGDVPGG